MKYLVSFLISLSILSLFPKPLQYFDTQINSETVEPKILYLEPTLSIEERILSTMNTQERVGQLFIFGFDGTALNNENGYFLKDKNVGGVLLLGKNISSEKQLKELTTNIQQNNRIPLFISIDQEGGSVARIKWNKEIIRAQPNIETSNEAYNDAVLKGSYLKKVGINMNFSPVLEYITDKSSFMYDRVYRGSRGNVLDKGISAINGYRDSGILAVPKHFPGHSNNSPDSHSSLPSVNVSEDQWEEYIRPFTDTFNNTNVDALMVGHIKYPKIDSLPSTISKAIITDRLINDLNYTGLVISDDMEMGALDNIDTYPKLAERALQAGVDILIFSSYRKGNSKNIQKDVYEYILQEVENNNMDINKKVLRILKVKMEYGILN